MSQAKYIVIEGIEGAGKTTAIEWVKHCLQQQGVEQVVTTREPGGTAIAEQIRQIVKTPEQQETLSPISELLLIYASRLQVVNNVVKPALAAGQWVISDRHDLSTRAYQGGGRQIDMQVIEQLHQISLNGFTPDFTLYLDIDPKLGLQRARSRGQLDRFEQEEFAFFQRIRDTFVRLAAANPNTVTIDASQSLDEVKQAIQHALQSIFVA